MILFKRSSFIILLVLLIGCEKKDNTKDVDPPNVGIHAAILMGDIEAVQQHIDAGTDINEDEWTHGSSPLITAAALGETEIAKLLINEGADINFRNDEGSTPLIAAAAFNHTDIAQLLIISGAKVDMANNDGSTALIIASLFSNINLVKSLLDNGANKYIENKFGRSAVSIAESPFEESIEILKKIEEGFPIKVDYEKIKQNRPIIAEMLK
jgi:ankyrin repeat protein